MSHAVTLLLAEKDCFEIPGQAGTVIRRITLEIALFIYHAVGNGRSPIPSGCSPVRADACLCPTGVRVFLTGVRLLRLVAIRGLQYG